MKGSLNYEEFEEMFTNYKFFDKAMRYMQESYVMTGDYRVGPKHTFESETYYLSGGTLQPM